MIVRNESTSLPGCLESVRGAVDEIVVVDTGSTDDTREVAARFGARVFSFPWRDDFADARNESLKHCTGDWVLMLDADERLGPGQAGALRACAADPAAFAYTVLVRGTATLPTGPSVQVMPYERFFRRAPGVRFEGTVHEQIAPSIVRLGGLIKPSSVTVEHLGYGGGVESLGRKAERNRRLLRARLKKNPGDSYACYHLGNMAAMFQNYGEAGTYLRRALASDGLPKPLRAVAWNILAEAELRSGRTVESAACCRSSLALAPVQVAARWYLVGTCVHGKDYAGALRHLQEILDIFFESPLPPPLDVSVDIQIEEWKVRHITGQCLWKTGDTAAALRSFACALQLNPSSVEIQANFSTALKAARSGEPPRPESRESAHL